MNANSMNRFRRVAVVGALMGIAAVAFHQDIIGRVAYAVEKGKLEAGQENLAQISKAEDISELFRRVARQVKPAVVLIRTTTSSDASKARPRRRIDPKDIPEQLRPFFDEFGGEMTPTPRAPQQSSGSGVIVDAGRGYIITNNHVVSEGEDTKSRIDVQLADGRRLAGKVLGTDPKTDLALVQIKADRLHAAPLGDSAKMEVGDWVVAVGAPFGLDQTVTQGIISATGRSNVGIANYGDFLQTDAAINPGNSGGPLVNMRGEVIGINTAIATSGMSAGYMGVGFAIPSAMVKDILPYLEKGEEVVRGYLGVQIRGFDTYEPGFEKTFGLPEGTSGVLVNDYASIPGVEETPAQKAGIKPDDVILSYDGKDVRTATELTNIVAHTPPGTKVNLKVWRDGKAITIPVTIERQPKNFFAAANRNSGGREGAPGDDSESETEQATIEAVGITVEPLTAATAARYGWKDDKDARGMLIVTEVEALGEARAMGIDVGDLIVSVQGEPVKTVPALKKALSKEALAKGVRIKVRKPRLGSSSIFLQISP